VTQNYRVQLIWIASCHFNNDAGFFNGMEVMKIKLSEILGVKTVEKKTRKATLGLLITGILAVVLVFVTIYGQFTGNYLITVTREASLKGIAISDKLDYKSNKDTLKVTPLNDIEDILPSNLDIEGARNVDGQYKDAKHYIAYTFYLRNSGEETVNVNYQVKIIDDYKKLGNAIFFRLFESELIGDEFSFISDETYSKFYTEKEIIADVDIINFRPNDVRKFTFFVWIDGDHSNESMLGGAVKLEFVFSITSAILDEES